MLFDGCDVLVAVVVGVDRPVVVAGGAVCVEVSCGCVDRVGGVPAATEHLAAFRAAVAAPFVAPAQAIVMAAVPAGDLARGTLAGG